MAAIQILNEIKSQGRLASEVLKVFKPVPQVLKNVKYSGDSPMEHPELIAAIARTTEELTGKGRVLIRASGTEPLIRVMVECLDVTLMTETVDELVTLVNELTR